MVFHDSLPELFIPVGFAGGLYDADTGLTRFGFRDYDPQVGRFTAKDPLGDTGGDHDVYDYCIDDPIGFYDDNGLKDKPWPRRLLEGLFPLAMLEGQEKEDFKKDVHLIMKHKTHEMTGGLKDLMRLNLDSPSVIPMPGPTEEIYQKMYDQHKEQKNKIMQEAEEFNAKRKKSK